MTLLSFRARMLVAFTASMLLGVFLLLILGNFYVNTLQRRQVEQAMELAREQARRLRDEVLRIVGDMPVSDMSDPRLRERMSHRTEVTLMQNRNVVWAAIVDLSSGAIVVQTGPEGEEVIRPLAPGGGTLTTPVDPAETGPVEMTVRSIDLPPGTREIREPIEREGKQLGEIRLGVRETPALERIETTSRQITSALIAESVFLLLFLLAVFWVLWRMFSRQVRLVQRNAALDQMAYVGTLASGLAHEIRNPLSAMNVNLDVVREELAESAPDSAARATELAGRVQREVQHLNATLSSFLDFALPTSSELTTVSLPELLRGLIESHSEELRQSGITCDLHVEPNVDLTIRADERLMRQVFRNLLVNAMQAVGSSIKKQIEIKLSHAHHDRIRVTVADSGPGIPAENLARIFEVFFSTRKGGSGFGLAIARKIVEAHGGSIRAENNVDRAGAGFIVELPKKQDKEKHATVAAHS